MRCCSIIAVAFCFALTWSSACRAVGLEAAEKAEEIIAFCRQKPLLARPHCLSANLSRKWRYELGYAGKPFSAVGRFAEVRRSIAGNVFAFVSVGAYRVACKVTRAQAEKLRSLEGRRVLIAGAVQGYHISFDLHRLHHLRLTPYCVVAAVV